MRGRSVIRKSGFAFPGEVITPAVWLAIGSALLHNCAAVFRVRASFSVYCRLFSSNVCAFFSRWFCFFPGAFHYIEVNSASIMSFSPDGIFCILRHDIYQGSYIKTCSRSSGGATGFQPTRLAYKNAFFRFCKDENPYSKGRGRPRSTSAATGTKFRPSVFFICLYIFRPFWAEIAPPSPLLRLITIISDLNFPSLIHYSHIPMAFGCPSDAPIKVL